MIISLECGHTKHVTVKNEFAFCRNCGKTMEVASDGYRVKCTNCRYGRYFGKNNFSARIYGVKHALIRNHKVIMYRPDGKEEETFTSDQGELPLDGSAPF